MRGRISVLLAIAALLGACSSPTEQASPTVRHQYLEIARTAAARTNLAISDGDWLKFADLVCSRRLLDDEDYEELIAEIEGGAPTPELGRAAADVGKSAISLFCPPEE
jgi:hypothetical protein